jgi:hypothetical protein
MAHPHLYPLSSRIFIYFDHFPEIVFRKNILNVDFLGISQQKHPLLEHFWGQVSKTVAKEMGNHMWWFLSLGQDSNLARTSDQ